MEIFPIAPGSSKPLWIIAVVCVVIAVVLAALVYTAYASRHSRVVLHADSISIEGDFWGRTISIDHLDLAEAKVVDLNSATKYYPRRRTFGTGLPGYASGWFRLHGGERALVYLTNRDRVAYVPTSDGYALLLSVSEPERFIAALKRRASST